MKKLLFIGFIFLMSCGCFYTDYKKIEKIKVGMNQQQMNEILGKIEWDSYDNGEYQYGVKYLSPSGRKNTFWIIVKNEKIINSYSL